MDNAIVRRRLLFFVLGVSLGVAATPTYAAEEAAAPASIETSSTDALLADCAALRAEAQRLREAGQFTEAIAIGEKLLPVLRQAVGKDHDDYVFAVEILASDHAHADDWSAAEARWTEAVALREKRQGADHWLTVNARIAHAYAQLRQTLTADQGAQLNEAESARLDIASLYAEGRYAEGIGRAEEVLAIHAAILGEQHPHYAQSLTHLADLHCMTGELTRAEPLYQQALEIQTTAYGARHPIHAQCVNKLAELYRLMGAYGRAEPLYRESLEIRRSILGDRHPEYAESLNNLALLHLARSEFEPAETLLLEVQGLLNASVGQLHPLYAANINNLADLYREMGQYDRAEPLYVCALEIREEALGNRHPDYAATLASLGDLYRTVGQFDRAEESLQRAEELLRSVLGERHPQYAESLFNLANLYRVIGDFERAERLYKQALQIRQSVLGERHVLTAQSLNHLAILYRTKGDFAQAELMFQPVLEIRREAYGDRHSETAKSFQNLALLYSARGKFAQAEELLVEVRGIVNESVGSKHPRYATSLHNLADVYVAMGNYAQAEPLYREAIDVRRQALGKNHPRYAESVLALANLFRATAEYSRAEPLYQDVLELTRVGLGERHQFYALALNNLAELYRVTDNLPAAADMQRQALEIRRTIFGVQNHEYAESLNNLALIYAAQGAHAEAEPLFVEAKSIYTAVFGETHPAVAAILNNLGDLHRDQGDFVRAEPLYKRAIVIRRAILGSRHPHYAQSRYNLAILYVAMGDLDRAATLFADALEIIESHSEATALAQDEHGQMATERHVRTFLDAFLSINLRRKTGAAEAYEAALRWKGATLFRQRAARLAAGSPTLAPIFNELQSVVRQWSVLIATPPVDGPVCKLRIEDLAGRKQSLETDLSRESAAVRAVTDVPRLADVQSALPEDAVLVDYVEFSMLDFAPERPGAPVWRRSLAAFVVRPGEEVELLLLGEAERIHTAVDQWRLGFGASPESKQAGALLRQRLWEPLLPTIGDATTVLVSPDGALGKFPFAALPGAAPDTYLIEDVSIALAPVPRLIVASVDDAQPAELAHELFVVGGVNYNQRATVVAKPVVGEAPQDSPAPSRGGDALAQRSVWLGDGRWRYLRGTHFEARFVADLFERLRPSAGENRVIRLSGDDATEEEFRRLAPQSRLLHVATHGFFAVEQEVPGGTALAVGIAGLSGDHLATVRGHSPGLLSGLVLAGANNPPPIPDDPAQQAEMPDDGILTAEEIAFLPLGGAQLVVLSACESGLGEAAGGEGLLGIQRAFQVAGADTTIATLWKVNDLATRLIMEEFYSNYLERKMSPLEALRAAQLWALRNPGEVRGVGAPTEGAARLSPEDWAAFTLSGDWR